MDTPHEMAKEAGDRIVYVRPMHTADLPDELRQQTGDLDEIYSVHAPNGDRLALVRDRKLAFALARQHDFTPVDVH
ncbi:DUF1150 family protein [Qingshengfaniella alkalisoli]|uniref:DUF1150 family protein n=1 Tax=Qingshengfaniella alkalisoli TaxID=2599296 RepID=A0A5B8J002_9RHOB|nr:DUF1150 family protein [Qingshengfaniella alkalisoli]QDY70198.1 DUF1150 family protein [Qingshengfaniella alkalisoli]